MLKKQQGDKHDLINLLIETDNYDVTFENKKLTNTTRKSYKEVFLDFSEMSLLEDDEEEVKEGKEL